MIKLVPNRTMLVVIPRIAAVLFILLQLLGMQVYPGGTMYDASTEGYSFSMNFFRLSLISSTEFPFTHVCWFEYKLSKISKLLSLLH